MTKKKRLTTVLPGTDYRIVPKGKLKIGDTVIFKAKVLCVTKSDWILVSGKYGCVYKHQILGKLIK